MKASELKIYLDRLMILDPDARIVVGSEREGDPCYSYPQTAQIEIDRDPEIGDEYVLIIY